MALNNILIAAAVVALLAWAFYSSPDDVQKCVEVTGMSEDACRIALTR